MTELSLAAKKVINYRAENGGTRRSSCMQQLPVVDRELVVLAYIVLMVVACMDVDKVNGNYAKDVLYLFDETYLLSSTMWLFAITSVWAFREFVDGNLIWSAITGCFFAVLTVLRYIFVPQSPKSIQVVAGDSVVVTPRFPKSKIERILISEIQSVDLSILSAKYSRVRLRLGRESGCVDLYFLPDSVGSFLSILTETIPVDVQRLADHIQFLMLLDRSHELSMDRPCLRHESPGTMACTTSKVPQRFS